MTSKELRKILARAGLSQSEGARLLDLSDRTIRKYIADDLPIPRVVEYALLHVIAQRKKEAGK